MGQDCGKCRLRKIPKTCMYKFSFQLFRLFFQGIFEYIIPELLGNPWNTHRLNNNSTWCGDAQSISTGMEGRQRQAGWHSAGLLGLFPELNNLQWGAPSTIHTRNLIQLSKVNGLCATYVTVNVAIVCNWSLPADYLPCSSNARMHQWPFYAREPCRVQL